MIVKIMLICTTLQSVNWKKKMLSTTKLSVWLLLYQKVRCFFFVKLWKQGYFRALCNYQKMVAKTQSSTEVRNMIFCANTFSYHRFKLCRKKYNLLNVTKQDITSRAYKLSFQLSLVFIVISCTFCSHNLVVSGQILS